MKQLTPKAAVRKFGEERWLPIVTYTHGKKDDPPKQSWDAELWVESAEDWYGLMSYTKGETIRIVERHEWMAARKDP